LISIINLAGCDDLVKILIADDAVYKFVDADGYTVVVILLVE
jgi:hypothetical protein